MLKKILPSFLKFIKLNTLRSNSPRDLSVSHADNLSNISIPRNSVIGVIAGNGPFPFVFAKEARQHGHEIVAVCHKNETDPDLEYFVNTAKWIKVGELGSLIKTFKENSVRYVAMAGGISRVKHFGDVKLDLRGSALMLKLRSTKDDVIMRGIADELMSEGIEVIPCTCFLKSLVTPEGLLTQKKLSKEEEKDIQVGIEAIVSMSSQHIGQLVVVREGVIVAVEAAEGTNETILRGGKLGGSRSVVVKCAKVGQDMRFDVPTVGMKTIDTMNGAGCRVLALEAGRSIILEKDEVIEAANKKGITIVGIPPIIKVSDKEVSLLTDL